MTMAATDIAGMKSETDTLFQRKRMIAFGIPGLILLYFAYVFFAFDIPGLADRARWENGATLVRDSYSYKTHVTRDNDDASVEVSIEGSRNGIYPEGETPEWVTMGEQTRIDLGEGHVIVFGPEDVSYDIPGYGLIVTTPGDDGVNAVLPAGDVPDWINAGENRIAITTDQGRLTVTRSKAEVFRYEAGWEMFFFTLDSPYSGMSFGEVAGRFFSGEAGAIVREVWTNKQWHHDLVFKALYETLLMAFLGTFGAAIVALPLAFLGARNFSAFWPVRVVARRLFDFLRGVDGLIWTVVLSRAFGGGALTGAIAILLTDTGSFGKLFSEALENVDEKEIEGVKSTGAAPVQRYRFGVIPQVTPVFLSQILYFLESNTRSATIIGAIAGGGIGPLLTNAISNQNSWEAVSYYIILVVFIVIFMDWLSGVLRRRLIQGNGSGH